MGAAESRAAASKRWREQNGDLKRQYDREYYAANKETLGARHAVYRENEKTINPRARMLRNSKCRAKIRGLPFDLTIDDIIIPLVCPVLGLQLEIASTIGGLPNSPSLDRIDSSKGYVKGNVRVISNRANKLKSNATARELELVLEDIKHHENQNR